MKVVDKHGDYFDHAGGIDPTIVLDRNAIGGNSTSRDGTLPGLPNGIVHTSTGDHDTILPVYVLVGGRGIPAIITNERYHRTPKDVVYDAPSFLAAFDAFVARLDAFEQEMHRKPLRALRDQCLAFLHSGQADVSALCVEVPIITGIVYNTEGHLSSLLTVGTRYAPKMTFEPGLLRDFGLDRVLPAHEAHMMVAQFVGGVMTSRETTIELSDPDRLDKAGFDRTISFRTRKNT